MEVSFVLPPLFPDITELLTIEWSGPLPMPGDTIDIHYYLDTDKYDKLYEMPVVRYRGMSDWEAGYVGQSFGNVFDAHKVEVVERYWPGTEHGVVLTCQFSILKKPES